MLVLLQENSRKGKHDYFKQTLYFMVAGPLNWTDCQDRRKSDESGCNRMNEYGKTVARLSANIQLEKEEEMFHHSFKNYGLLLVV